MAELENSTLKSKAALSALESHSAAVIQVLDPFVLSNELCSEGITDGSVLDKIITSPSSTREEKATETVTAIVDRVQSTADIFTKFCDVLNRDPSTKEVARVLKKSYEDSLVNELHRTFGPEEFAKLCLKEGMVESGARLVVRAKDSSLCSAVLNIRDEQCRQSFIDQITHSVIAELEDPDAVSTVIKAFMMADLPNELIALLEHIILREDSIFKENKNLQNLLILTTIKARQARVMELICRLENYDGQDIAQICVSYSLYEEAFTIYKKFDLKVAAIKVLIEHVKDMDRAREFAEQCNLPEVWKMLESAQL